MLIERRAEPRNLPMSETPKPVCTIMKGLTPPNGKPIFFAFSNVKKGVVIGSDYMDAFFKYYGICR